MGSWRVVLKLVTHAFSLLSWSSFALIYPLCVSVWSIESDSSSKSKKCLTYWILFALITMLEPALMELLTWLPFWPYAKGIAVLLLVTPRFAGASYVYTQFIKQFIENSEIWDMLLLQTKKNFLLNTQIGLVGAADTKSLKNGPEPEKLVFQSQQNLDPISDSQEVDQSWTSCPKKVKKEYSCALSLISTTTSEKCLQKHLRGKKHETNEEEQPADKAVKTAEKPSLMLNKTNMVIILGLLAPVTRSIRRCRWKKPEIGWIKLNADGSVYCENASFGGLLRDHKGDPICAFVSKAPGGNIFLVELWAIWRGLVLALSLGVKVVWVESDSLPVVKTINRKQRHHGTKASQCLKHIWELLTKFENYKVTHSWRETNKAADHLSKMVLVGNDVVLWPVDFPKSLQYIIQDDAQGRIYYRRRSLPLPSD